MINEITIKEINQLTDIQLSEVLHSLIKQEFIKFNITDYEAFVPFNITVADGGEDAIAKWTGEPKFTDFLKNRHTLFQNKATKLPPSKCMDEILEPIQGNSTSRKLKGQIEKLVKNNGCYILFTNQSIVTKGKEDRIAKFREAIKVAGEKNYQTFQIIVYDANDIKDWVNNFISTVTLVQGFNNMTRPFGFRIWEGWEKHSKAKDNLFQTDENTNNNIDLIKQINDKKCIRVSGHSGLGKSRLVLEAFRESNLKNSVVYYDLEGGEDITGLKNFIISHQNAKEGIIVIDNCDSKRHIVLSSLVKDEGNIRIITIGFDDNASIDDSKIRLERDKQKKIVQEIVEHKIGDKRIDTDIRHIVGISEGYPAMAIKFCDIVLKDGMFDLTTIPLKNFIEKLLYHNDGDSVAYEVLRACSVFSSFGFLDDSFRAVINTELSESLKAQMNFIRTQIYDGDISQTKFNEICSNFINDDIIEKKGIFYIVKPTVLAVNLAAEWLMYTDADRVVDIVQNLQAVGLEQKFVDRLKDLNQLDKAKEIVKDLWGARGPFGSAEVLNTLWGSQLFRNVVEVNPEVTAEALQFSFGRMSKEELFTIQKSRRNLVGALEKLCFRKETFNIAAKILFSFAVSENETWGNNSTNQFNQLFQIYLSGTEVNLDKRLEIIKWGLSKNDDDYARIAIDALGRGLKTDHFMRMGGAEKQGSNSPLKDYHPDGSEVFDYWKKIVVILTDVATSNNQFAATAQNILAQSIRGLSRLDSSQLIIDSIRKILPIRKNIWTEAINNLKMTLSYEEYLSDHIKDQIKDLLYELTPKDFRTELFMRVTKPEWEPYEKDEEDYYIDKPKINVEKFAEKVISQNLNWTLYLEDLLQGEQRQAYNFGKALGAGVKFETVQKIISTLKKIPVKDQNIDLLAGIIVIPSNRAWSDGIIAEFISDSDLRHHVFNFTRYLEPSYEELNKLFILIDKYGYSINQFQTFQYGRSLENLSVDEMLELNNKIITYGKLGRWTSLDILFMFCFGRDDRWGKCESFFRNLLIEDNMTIGNIENGRLEKYHWSQVAIRILNSSYDKEFAVVITKQIIEFCSERNFDYSFDSYIHSVMDVLLDKYFTDVWEYIGNAIQNDYLTFFHLQQFIGTKNGYLTGSRKKDFLNPKYYDYVLKWCKQNSQVVSERIASLMPLNQNIGNTVKWHPFSQSIIDLFGNNEKLLSQLSSNMGTFGTSGSRVPYFETQKLLLESLLNHHFEEVKNWAGEKLKQTEDQIKIEKLNDEQFYL